eukprot:TRINITY_DN2608_c0_g2_i1.p1 TRINITY_DN2608_c0_g2~~TRINITY_DN2608_c0_g2_i1.p1  ORF type:complete len:1062 (-),score=192.65 TRINITY_DN2608_c0_g2_i1:135-3254(-)
MADQLLNADDNLLVSNTLSACSTWQMRGSATIPANEAYIFEVTLGDSSAKERVPTCLFGLSTCAQPALGDSAVFRRPWPGVGLRGIECHECGDAIGWFDSSPIERSSANFTFVKSTYFPGDTVQLLLEKRGRLHVFYNRCFKYTFGEVFDRQNSPDVYFHLYVQDKRGADQIRCRRYLRKEDEKLFGLSKLQLTARPMPIIGKTYGKKSIFEQFAEAPLLKKFAPGVVNALTSAHTGSIFDVCSSPDGLFLITASGDRSMKIWHAQTAKCEFTLKSGCNIDPPVEGAPEGSVRSAGFFSLVCWSDDLLVEGSWNIAAGRGDGYIDVWTVLPPYAVGTLRFEERVRHCCRCTHDAETPRFGVQSMAFDMRMKAIVSVGGNTLKMHKVALAQDDLPHDSRGRNPSVHSRFSMSEESPSPCASSASSWGWRCCQDEDEPRPADRPIHIYFGNFKGRRGFLSMTETWSFKQGGRQVVFSPNFKQLVVAASDRQVQVRSSVDGRILHTILHQYDVTSVWMTPNELLFGDAKGNVLMYKSSDLPEGKKTDIRPENPEAYRNYENYASTLEETRGKGPLPAKAFEGHVELAVWGVKVFTALRENRTRRFVLATSGSGLMKVWQLDADEIRPACVVTVYAQQAAVSAVHVMAGAHRSLREDVCLDYQELSLAAVVYTGGFDSKANRWNLTNQLNRGYIHTVNKAQQQYRNPSILELIKVPSSWFLTLALVINGFVEVYADQHVGEYPHPTIPFWPKYWISVAIAYAMIFVMGSDILVYWREEIDALMNHSDLGRDCQLQKKKHLLECKMAKLEYLPYVVSLYGLLTIFKNLLHMNDCAYIGKNLKLPFEGHDYKVLEVDPGVPCYTGKHLFLFLHNCVVLFFFLALTSPVYIILGDIRRLRSNEGWSQIRRLWERMSPLNWTSEAKKIWPGFAGSSSQRLDSYHFQVVFLLYQISVTSVLMLTTYNPHLRFTVDTGLGFVLLVVSFWSPPVQSPAFLAALRTVVFILCAYPFGLYVYEMHTELREAKHHLHELNRTLTGLEHHEQYV